ATYEAAASCWRRIRPTCGPLPCETTTSHPAAAMSATTSAAKRAAFSIASAVSGSPFASRAFPPRAITTRRTIEALQDRLQGVRDRRRALGLHEVVANPRRRLLDVHQRPEVDGGRDDHRVAVGGVDHLFEFVQLLRRVAHGREHRAY